MKLLAIAATALRRMFRDRSNYFFVFILPLGIIVIIGSLFGSQSQPSMGLVAPTSGLGAELGDRLRAIPGIEVVVVDDSDALVLSVERSNHHVGVSVPGDIDATLIAGEPVRVGFIARPDSIGPQLRGAVAAVVEEFSYDIAAARLVGGDIAEGIRAARLLDADLPPVAVSVSTVGDTLFPSSLGQFDLGASSQLVLFMFLTGLTGSAAMIQSRQLGVSRRMLGTPTAVSTLVAGEALGRFGVVLVQGLYIVFVTLIVFGVDWGDPLGAAAVIVLFGAVAAGAAMLMGTLFRNDQQAGGIGVMAGLGLAALGGSMMPVELMPDSMQLVSRATPHFWALDAFAELVRRQGTIVDIVPQLGVLALFAVVLLALASWRFRQVLTRGD